ncbi:type IV pilin protein [Methylothermus subterraneus]
MKTKGFTLIEVMVTAAIVAVLAAIAYPFYQSHVVKTRRNAAKACLMELAQYMERYYTTKMSYAGASLPSTSCQTELASFYSFAFEGTPSATSYTVKATAGGVQASKDAACTPLKVTHTGSKTPADCWK